MKAWPEPARDEYGVMTNTGSDPTFLASCDLGLVLEAKVGGSIPYRYLG
jgi:hypothetical protein